VLESFESSAPTKVPSYNTPLPCGVRCLPIADTDTDIVYGCTVYVSLSQTAASAGLTCKGLGPTLLTAAPDLLLAPIAAPDAGSDFGVSLPKASFPTLRWLNLGADCYGSTGSGLEVSRPYWLEPKKS
jgi:hypothetical protein